MKGIVLAGGAGTRLHPMTLAVSKQLMPVYNKPLVYYPLSVLMLAGIRDVLVITTPEDQKAFTRLLGDGSAYGLRLAYAQQPRPDGLAQALVIGESFLSGESCTLVLGDNLFFGHDLTKTLVDAVASNQGATVFAYHVEDPGAYGVVELDEEGRAVSLVEKPNEPMSNLAVTGLYIYGPDGPAMARSLRPSPRGELEITDLNRMYMEEERLAVTTLGRGFAWLDTGTPHKLLQAATFVEAVESRQGLMVACLEEIGFRNGWVTPEGLSKRAKELGNSPYGHYLAKLASGL